MIDLSSLAAEAEALVRFCTERGLKIATAESCTGGLVAGALTDIAGSSAVFDRGFVTYSNAAKADLLDVPAALITTEGSVSEAVATAMVKGALAHSAADIAVAITGIAGPGGGSPEKPVGLVHFAALRGTGPFLHQVEIFPDNGRHGIRLASVRKALAMVAELARA